MKSVFVLFLLLAVWFAGWRLLPKDGKLVIRSWVRKLWAPFVIAALVTVGILFFALNSNGRIL